MNSLFIISLFVIVFTLSVTVIIEKRLIPFLSKRAAQPIYTSGPSWHLSKSGTPTMGGLAFLISISISLAIAGAILLSKIGDFYSGVSIFISLLYAIGNALIGIFDDLVKLRRKENAGLSPMQKIILQSLLAVLFLMARGFFCDDPTVLKFNLFEIEIGLLYFPLAMILLLGVVNCANLSDGVDGLASSVGISIGSVFLLIGITGIKTEVSILSSALIGGAIGFLIFNRHPAKIFMGDTGSLFLGAIAVSLAFSSGNPMTVIFVGGVYVIEGLSVILQVVYFKLTKKRLFKMAPIHHHLEKCGYSENQICIIAVLVTLILSLAAPLLL